MVKLRDIDQIAFSIFSITSSQFSIQHQMYIPQEAKMNKMMLIMLTHGQTKHQWTLPLSLSCFVSHSLSLLNDQTWYPYCRSFVIIVILMEGPQRVPLDMELVEQHNGFGFRAFWLRFDQRTTEKEIDWWTLWWNLRKWICVLHTVRLLHTPIRRVGPPV